MKRARIPAVFFIFLSAVYPVYGQQLQQRVVLIGDAGKLSDGKIPAVEKYRQLFTPDDRTTFIFLGDNIYPSGMPSPESALYAVSRDILDQQIAAARNSRARVFFVPGNHDWAQGRSQGLERVRNQQRYIDSLSDPLIQLLPGDGCPGPKVIPAGDKLLLVFMDSQWWLQRGEKPGLESDCDFKSGEEAVLALRDIVNANPDKLIILAMHHPFHTYGKHGGHFTFKQHLFPLTEVSRSLYIPLPVIGSVYPLSRSLFGNIQDTKHPEYRNLINQVEEVIAFHENVIHAAGHEHALQLIRHDSVMYVVSGSGSKETKVKKGKKSLYAHNGFGFCMISMYDDGTVNLDFFTEESTSENEPAFSTSVTRLRPDKETVSGERLSFPDSVTVIASDKLSAGGFKKFLLGKNYRKEWGTPIRVPVLNLSAEKGGLVPTRRGGGHQTRSIRLEDSSGREYVLRSVEKFPTDAALPPDLRGTFVKDLVADGVSASYPYAALSIPPLAEANHIFHANPRLVFVPDDPELGVFRTEFGNKFYLFEERQPDGVDKTYSTDKMHDKLRDDNDNTVDQHAFLRARLLDMFVMDFDRHEDQWRWAARDNGKGKTFLPIPRDRDQPFFINVGLFPHFASRPWVAPQIQGFRVKAENINTYNFNARNLDRAFLNELSEEDWVSEVEAFLQTMTDELIGYAMSKQPPEIKNYSLPKITRMLKERRNYFKEEMMTYYRFLSKTVNITGSGKEEFFDLEVQKGGRVKVTVRKITKEGEVSKVLYQRIFDPSVTRELRVYGLEGKDRFSLSGESSSIRIRIIGGDGKDLVEVNHRSPAGKTLVYDKANGKNQITGTGRYRNRLSDHPDVNNYDWQGYHYNKRMPFLSVNYNPDDGIYLGALIRWTRQNFRKEPFSAIHTLSANHALATKAFDFTYAGEYIRVFGQTDILFNADIKAPNNVINFFGYGNESEYDKARSDKIRYYRARFNLADISLLLRKKFGKSLTLSFGPAFQYASVDSSDNVDRYLNQTALNGLDKGSLYERKAYLGGEVNFAVDTRNSKGIPTRGIFWKNSFRVLGGLTAISKDFSTLLSDLTIYHDFSGKGDVVLALRAGGGITLNGFEFYQSRFLSGTDNLRGYRKYRFAGRSVFYTNAEWRIRLAEFRTYLFPASLGILCFYDGGKVWLKNNRSDVWHNGIGAGIWMAPLKRFAITASYTHSEEGGLPLISFGFQF